MRAVSSVFIFYAISVLEKVFTSLHHHQDILIDNQIIKAIVTVLSNFVQSDGVYINLTSRKIVRRYTTFKQESVLLICALCNLLFI